MKALCILLLSLLIVSDAKTDYSIDTFIKFLQENGYYDILMQIKLYYGDDIAISLCKNFIKSEHCELLVRVYIHIKVRGPGEDKPSLRIIIFNPDNYNFYKDKAKDIINWIENNE